MSEKLRTVLVIDYVHPDEWCVGQASDRDRWPIEGAELAIGDLGGYSQRDPVTGRGPRLWGGHNIALVEPTDDLPEDIRQHVQKLHNQINQHTFAIVIHGTEVGVPYAQYHSDANPVIKGLAYYLGFRRVLIANSGLSSHKSVLEVELAINDLITVDRIFNVIPEVVGGLLLPEGELEEFRHIHSLRVEDARACGVPKKQDPFTSLSPGVTQRLNERLRFDPPLDEIYVSCLDEDHFAERTGGYWGELCVPHRPNTKS